MAVSYLKDFWLRLTSMIGAEIFLFSYLEKIGALLVCVALKELDGLVRFRAELRGDDSVSLWCFSACMRESLWYRSVG
jgi:hypothetical protein